jgi:hypothetical protein
LKILWTFAGVVSLSCSQMPHLDSVRYIVRQFVLGN